MELFPRVHRVLPEVLPEPVSSVPELVPHNFSVIYYVNIESFSGKAGMLFLRRDSFDGSVFHGLHLAPYATYRMDVPGMMADVLNPIFIEINVDGYVSVCHSTSGIMCVSNLRSKDGVESASYTIPIAMTHDVVQQQHIFLRRRYF